MPWGLRMDTAIVLLAVLGVATLFLALFVWACSRWGGPSWD